MCKTDTNETANWPVVVKHGFDNPFTRRELSDFVKRATGIKIPDRRVCPEHNSPMDYLWHCFSERKTTLHSKSRLKTGDCIVWANRGGGKTMIAAILTLLDSLFKPGCETRILGGSGEQSSRMYEYFSRFIITSFNDYVEKELLKTKCRFKNGSRVEILTQSIKSVRGQHVQKLRCDEVELFDRDVFNAAHFTTHSTNEIRASMELLSTMHKPYGLMQREVEKAVLSNKPIFKWCIWEVIEKCKGRSCSRCLLEVDCRGKARRANGYLKIDDVINQMQRSSRAVWESEMLCLRPSLENIVFPDFSPDIHVRPIDFHPELPLFRSIDFGYVNPFVCLWIQVDSDKVFVLDEYVMSKLTIENNAQNIIARTPIDESRICATFCDPSGYATNDVSGRSEIGELARCGIRARGRSSKILEGIEMIRQHLRSGQGKASLFISPKCVRLIEAFRCYHYDDNSVIPSEKPYKDGIYDHPIDALRYFYINWIRKRKFGQRTY